MRVEDDDKLRHVATSLEAKSGSPRANRRTSATPALGQSRHRDAFTDSTADDESPSGLVANLWAASSEETNGKLKLGDPIPAVTSTDQNGKAVNLAEVAKTDYTLVYLYLKAMTPGCTAQACSLRDSYTELQEKNVKVFGVSLDSVETQKEFEQKEHFPFELSSDTDRQVTSAFGVPLIKNAFATRQAYLFKDGKLVWLDIKASTDKQSQDVLAVLASSR